MAERYSKIFKYRENTYAEGSPVIISAGALLSDNTNNSLLAQLKFCSVSEKKIKALTVEITQLDTAERVLGEKIKHQYLDLNINIGEMFGSKTAIPIKDMTTRAFLATVEEVVFEDNSVWKSDNSSWEQLPSLERKLSDFDLLKQFELKYGFEYKTHLKKEKDLWFCFCGTINKGAKCHNCHRELSKLEEFDIEILKSECEERLAEERKENERIAEELRIKHEKEQEEAAIRAKRYKKIAAIVTPIICAIIAFVIVLNNVIIPTMDYNKAVSLMESGQYKEAISAFDLLEGYKDSKDKIKECKTAIINGKYDFAISLIEQGKYVEAYNALDALNGYKDSSEKMDSIYEKYKKEKLKSAKAGDYVKFGKYEMDNETYNGSEEIEWLVLEVKNNKAFLVSKYLVDYHPYHSERDSDISWASCLLRKWLNKDFIKSAFNDEERKQICKSKIFTELYENSEEGEYTTDRVFLLSLKEAKKYFATDKERICSYMDGSKHIKWWLRSFAEYNGVVYVVFNDGDTDFSYMDSLDLFPTHDGVRPAMWIDLSKIK